MSPSPERSSKPSLPDQTPLDNSLNRPLSAADPSATSAENLANSGDSPQSAEKPLVPKRPLMRPVNRPQPPEPAVSTTATAAKPAVSTKPEAVSSPVVVTPVSNPVVVPHEPAFSRNQPIPPPSEPKQYRAIGLVRGRYTPSDEQFTRGTMTTGDGTEIEAVLLGRVMSLVKNHLDLEQEHLWVVYPRTRETKQDLHVQVVGVWEPEKLNKDAEADEAEPTPTIPEPTSEFSPGYQDDYFSIRGEIVFHSVEDQHIIVKIQQAPRKSSDKAKAFKLRLEGLLESPKLLGYFWDLHVERQGTALTIKQGSPIGLVPPKKKVERSDAGRGKFRKNFRDSRPGGARVGSSPAAPPTRREPLPKPVKRTEVNSSEE